MVSPRKIPSALSSISEGKEKMNPITSKSCESLYSNTSSKGSANIAYGTKINDNSHNKPKLFRGLRQSTMIPATNEVRQRVLSARRLRMKTYQNQLADAQQTIAELAHENRILRTLHKRQDSALSKYESTNAELPQLLHSHAEELRVWQTKYRNLQTVNKELEQKLKQKESIILTLSDQNKYYIQLNKDKNLEDRQRLTEKLQTLETRLQEKDNDIKMMARKMQLENKQSKQQLQLEQKRNREMLMRLEKVRLELSGYRKLEELKFPEKFNTNLKRNKGTNNDDSKEEIEKYSLADIVEAKTLDKTETPNSQRSTYSSNNIVQCTTRSLKNLNTKNNSTLSSSTIVIQQSSKQTSSNKTIAVLRRIDQGDGDAAIVNDDTNNSLSTSLMQKQNSSLSSISQSQPDNDYEDDEYESSDVNDVEENKECEEILSDNNHDDSDENTNFVRNIDGSSDGGIDSYNDCKKIESYNPVKKTRMKDEISSIRKQISDDFKERESFLDNFCRQASNGLLRDEAPKKHTSAVPDRNVPNNRKNKLLAALKAIDNNKSQD